MNKFCAISFLSAIVAMLTACSGGKGAAGLKAYNIGEYDRAQKYLEKAVSTEKQRFAKGQYAFYLAECYRRKCYFKKAASNYKLAIRNKYTDDTALLHMGDCLRAAGDFEKANEAYALYLQKHTGDLLAQTAVRSSKLAEGQWDALQAYDYKNAPDSGYVIHLAKPFNSKYSDYCAAYVDDDYDVVYFTSMRLPKKRKKVNRVTGQGNSSIYMSRVDGRGDWTDPEVLPDPFSTQIDEGTPSLTSDGKTMFFTRCPYDATQMNTAQCFEISRKGGRWGDPVRVIPGGDSTIMVAHPAISPDGNTLYFVSDCDGGIGGKDIYLTNRNVDGSWGPPQNLGGLINTKGDEMFPYVRDNGILYFSSNGHVGYGGLDIYKATITETGRYEVTNLGTPINSGGDDFGIVFMGNREAGLLSSNRKGNKGIDKLYTFELPEIVLQAEGRVVDSNGSIPEKAFVRVVGSDGTNNKIRVSDDGNFYIHLDKDTEYILLCGARGCINKKLTISTFGRGKSETLKLDVALERVP